ncbi:MAG: EF-hand domain-containing protein [Akkermansiaceae bacterium]|nr:EF-hand domain-containing protein [Akkermansiaceae bacterium]
MKTIPVCPIFGCLLALCSPLSGQQREGGAEAYERKAGERWKKVDLDGDGSLSRDEFARMERLAKVPEEKRQALFERLDKNGDGRIERSEMLRRQGDGRPHPLIPRIGELDQDGDGAVSFQEFQAGKMVQRLEPERQQRLFARLDSNQDGRITPEDKPRRRAGPGGGPKLGPNDGPGADGPRKPSAGGLIQHLDKDGDGAVSLEEFSANPRMQDKDAETIRKRYEALDRNGDGKVDRSDFRRPQRDVE